VSPARAAINAALEAARAATAARTGARPPARPAEDNAAAPAASIAPVPPQPAGSAPQGAQARQAPGRPAPWEDDPAGLTMGAAAVLEAPPPVQHAQAQPRQAPAQAPSRQAAEEDDLPPWVTEFSDDSAVPAARAESAPAPVPVPAPVPAPARQATPAQAPYAYVITPVPALDWDGNWPLLAAHLPLRGVAQQLATQAELIDCTIDGNAALFRLRCPIDTWRTPPNVEKLTAALAERFDRPVRVETELGPVWYTTTAEQQVHREACQRKAEAAVHGDPFVQSMVREFGAFVVPGSIVAPVTPAH
jgi:DNA polymerase-3 subunit gamma/tau